MSEAKGPYRFEYDSPPGSTKLGGIVDANGAFVMTSTRQVLDALNAAHAAGVEEGFKQAIEQMRQATTPIDEDVAERLKRILNQ